MLYKLEDFDNELHKRILEQKLLHWDDTVINIDKKTSMLKILWNGKTSILQST